MKIRTFIKNNILGIIIGGVIFGSITGVVAATIASSNITYTNNGQSTVEGAIDDLYSKANTWINPNNMGTPQYYAYTGAYEGWCNSNDTVCNSYADFPTTSTTTPEGRNVYAVKYEDGQYGVCINRGGQQHCFRGSNWIAEAKHVQEVFSDISCDVNDASYVDCEASDFSCLVGSNGYVSCHVSGTFNRCYVDYAGIVECRE